MRGRFTRILVFPDADDQPPLVNEGCIGAPVPANVGCELQYRLFVVGLRVGGMLRATVPEAAIEKDRHASAGKHDVRPGPHVANAHQHVLAEAQANAVKLLSEVDAQGLVSLDLFESIARRTPGLVAHDPADRTLVAPTGGELTAWQATPRRTWTPRRVRRHAACSGSSAADLDERRRHLRACDGWQVRWSRRDELGAHRARESDPAAQLAASSRPRRWRPLPPRSSAPCGCPDQSMLDRDGPRTGTSRVVSLRDARTSERPATSIRSPTSETRAPSNRARNRTRRPTACNAATTGPYPLGRGIGHWQRVLPPVPAINRASRQDRSTRPQFLTSDARALIR